MPWRLDIHWTVAAVSMAQSGAPPGTNPKVPGGSMLYLQRTRMNLELISPSTILKIGSRHVIGRILYQSLRSGVTSPSFRHGGNSPAKPRLQTRRTGVSCSSVRLASSSIVVNRPVFPLLARPMAALSSPAFLKGAKTSRKSLSRST